MPELHGLDYTHDGFLLGAAVRSLSTFATRLALALGGTAVGDDLLLVADATSPCMFSNNVVVQRPLLHDPPDTNGALVVDRIRSQCGPTGGPVCVWSAWPTPDLTASGLVLGGHPPVMYRPAGPPPPRRTEGCGASSGTNRTTGRPSLRVVEATDAATVLEAERVLIEGYPMPDLLGTPPGASWPTAFAADPEVRVWVGYDPEDRPVATATAHIGDEVNLVEAVAVRPEVRGCGFGEAITWAATLADPTMPALLEASDAGAPVYRSMGYLPVSRMTLWILPR